MKKIICITGASSGFGEACAFKFSENHYDLIIAGRREEKLITLKETLEKKFGNRVHVLRLDVSDRTAVENAFKFLPDEWKKIDLLLNNAGLALGRDNFDEASIDDWERMIDTNMKGLSICIKGCFALHDCQ